MFSAMFRIALNNHMIHIQFHLHIQTGPAHEYSQITTIDWELLQLLAHSVNVNNKANVHQYMYM